MNAGGSIIGKVVGDREVWNCSIADLHCIFMCSFVYAAVEARFVFQELYLKSSFIKAASIRDFFCKQGIHMKW